MSKGLEALKRQKANVKKLRNKEFVEYKEDFDLLEKLIKQNKKLKDMVQTMFNGMSVEPNDKNSSDHKEWSYIFNKILGELHDVAKDNG